MASATRITVEIVRKAVDQVGFTVHKRRCVVEQFFAWLGRNRRFYRDVERLISSAEAFLYAASAIILIRRIGRCLSDSE
jgi:transposase